MHISSEIAHRRSHSPIECTPECQVSAQTHSCRANSAIARLEVGEAVNAERGIFIVGGDFLRYFPSVAVIGAFSVVGKGCGAGELVVAAGRRNDVAVGGNLTCEALNGASHWGKATTST